MGQMPFLKDKHTLTWESFMIFYDDSISESTLSSLQIVLSEDAAIASFNMGANPADSIVDILKTLPARQLGHKFLVIAKEESVSSIHKRFEAAGLMNIETEWLYLVTDSKMDSEMMPDAIKQAQDGYNLAFLYNASNPSGVNCKVSKN